jgi:hypothetical protein
MPSPSTRKNNVVPISRPKRAQGVAAPPAGISHDDIARRAYEIYEVRGKTGGSPLEDWVLAEQQLASLVASAVAKRSRASKTGKAPR